MKKFFSLFAAMLAAVALNAAVIQINNSTADALRLALNSAQSGDIIEMAAGTYVESPENYIAFTGKNVTVRAAEGAEVIIQPNVPIRLKSGARAEFIGIKFDCGHLSDVNSYSHMFLPADNSDGKKFIMNNCEFYNWTQNSALFQTPSDRKLDSLVINNCYFHGCTKSVIHFTNANLVGMEIKNSTFANIDGPTDSYWAAPIYVQATTGTVLVDHCTFYDVKSMSLSYGAITTTTSTLVSNCIMVLSQSIDMCATNLPEGSEVKNTLTYQYANWQEYGHYNTATKTACVWGDPLFVDAANGNFKLGATSPAIGVGTEGSNLGDPRWGVAEPVVTDYYLVGSFNDWTASDENYKFAANPEAEGEYMLMGVELAANAEIKVISSTGTWYPDNAGNYVVNEAGTYDIYFRPDGQGSSDWYYGYFYVAAQAAEPVAVAKNFEIDMQTEVFGGAMAQYLYIDAENAYNYSADAPAEYNAYFEAQGFTAGHGYHQLIVTVPVEAGNYRVMLGKCQYAYSADYTMAYVKTLDNQVLGSGKQNTTSAEEGGVCYHQDTEHNKVRIDFVSAEAQMVKIYCAHYTPYIKFEKINDTTGLQNTAVDGKVVKTIENGQLIIIKNGVRYNAVGAQL